MRLQELSRFELLARCRGEGLAWQIGPFSVRVRTRVREVVDGIAFLYSHFSAIDGDAIVDAELTVRRSLVRPRRIAILVDGATQYGAFPRAIAVPMLEWAMNVCVFQRPHEYFMLHAAVLERDGKALILPGRAGSGKSTLCAGLAFRGWRLLSDEVALIRPADGRIVPVPRPISLKDASIGVVRDFAPDATIGPAWPGTSKGTVAHVLPPPLAVERVRDAADPAWLVFPAFDPRSRTELERVPKGAAMIRAADNAFNYSVHGLGGFEMLADLVGRCACLDLRFGNLDAAVQALDRLREDSGLGLAEPAPPSLA